MWGTGGQEAKQEDTALQFTEQTKSSSGSYVSEAVGDAKPPVKLRKNWADEESDEEGDDPSDDADSPVFEFNDAPPAYIQNKIQIESDAQRQMLYNHFINGPKRRTSDNRYTNNTSMGAYNQQVSLRGVAIDLICCKVCLCIYIFLANLN